MRPYVSGPERSRDVRSGRRRLFRSSGRAIADRDDPKMACRWGNYAHILRGLRLCEVVFEGLWVLVDSEHRLARIEDDRSDLGHEEAYARSAHRRAHSGFAVESGPVEGGAPTA